MPKVVVGGVPVMVAVCGGVFMELLSNALVTTVVMAVVVVVAVAVMVMVVVVVVAVVVLMIVVVEVDVVGRVVVMQPAVVEVHNNR